MALAVLVASFSRPPKAEGRPAARCVRAGRPADDSQRIAVALIRGVAGVPAGRERARECAARRAELVQGIESVLHALEAMEEALRAPAVLRAGTGGQPSSELRHHLKCLRWAANMTSALQTAARTLKTLDSFDTPEAEYSEIAVQLRIIKETLQDLWGIVSDSCSTAPRRLKQVAEPAASAPVDKLEDLSDTCSTASGWWSRCVSEAPSEADSDSPMLCSRCEALAAAPSEADCDTPKRCSCCEALAAAPAPDGIRKGGRPCAPRLSSWADLLYWA